MATVHAELTTNETRAPRNGSVSAPAPTSFYRFLEETGLRLR
jgi:hypothetical protein